jgi:DNA-binding MarR family transcriptional regulator
MRNFSLPPAGALFMPVARFKTIITYDSKANAIEYKNDLDLVKIGLSKDFLKVLMKSQVLNELDLRMLYYILYKLEKESDVVCLNPKIIMRYLDWKSSSISDSIKRLCQEGYIKHITGRGNGRCNYQVNILYFFYGNRIDFLESEDTRLVRRTV